MPSKKRKYNARFPAGRIKKIMQTDEEVGKVAQAVPIIISRTLELFVESLLSKAMQVTAARNAKTLSPSHVKQCILAESRFDFLRDLVKNIPDVSAAEEKEMMSAESSPNSTSRFSDQSAPTRRVARQDSTSSSSSDVKVHQVQTLKNKSSEMEKPAQPVEIAMDLTKRPEEVKPVRTANFYQETLVDDMPTVITANPTYLSQPSTSSYSILNPVQPVLKVEVPVEKQYYEKKGTPVTPILNIDFTKSLAKPEIKVLDTAVANTVSVKERHKLQRQNSKAKPEQRPPPRLVDIDHLNSGNLQIDEDYDT